MSTQRRIGARHIARNGDGDRRRAWQNRVVQQKERAMPTLCIGLLLFPRMTQLDLTGPLEVFSGLPDAQFLLLSKSLEPVEADTGLRLLPNATLRDCPPLDVVCVPY